MFKNFLTNSRSDIMFPSKDRFEFRNPGYESSVLKSLLQQREDQRFLDCTICIGSLTIPAHRCLLASCSDYFDALLRFGDRQQDITTTTAREPPIQLDDLDPSSVNILIDYAYSGVIKISSDDVRNLLRTADFLCMTAVVDACCKYLIEFLDVSNCLSTFHFAVSLNNIKLVDAARHFILSKFADVANSADFLTLDTATLIEFAHDDRLIMTEKFGNELQEVSFFVLPSRQEELILESLLRYIEFDLIDRCSVLPQIMSSCVRLPLIPSAILIDYKEKNRLISLSKECVDIIDHALAFSTVPAQDVDEQISMETSGATSGHDHAYRQTDGSQWMVPRDLSNALVTKTDNTKLACQGIVIPADQSVPFNDADPVGCVQFVTGMKIFSRRWDGRQVIGGMLVTYNYSRSVMHGEDNYGYEVDEFTIAPNERITTVAASSGWMVDRLTFITNLKKNYGPYGGTGGGARRLVAPVSAYLAHISGTIDVTQEKKAVRNLQFTWACNKLESPYGPGIPAGMEDENDDSDDLMNYQHDEYDEDDDSGDFDPDNLDNDDPDDDPYHAEADNYPFE